MTRKSITNTGLKFGTQSDPVTFWRVYSDLMAGTRRST